MSIHTLAPDCDACFSCASCGKTVCADNEPVTCAHGNDPCCDDCCEREHDTSGPPHPVGGVECRETAREKAISQGDE